MATKKPLAMYNGKVKELQSGDDVGYIGFSKFKENDESIVSSTTLQDEDELTWYVKANRDYSFYYKIPFTIAAATGMKVAFTVPSGCTGTYTICTMSGTAAYTASGTAKKLDISTEANLSGINTSAAQTHLEIYGYLKSSSNAGNIVLRFSQQASNSTALVFQQGGIVLISEKQS